MNTMNKIMSLAKVFFALMAFITLGFLLPLHFAGRQILDPFYQDSQFATTCLQAGVVSLFGSWVGIKLLERALTVK